MLSTIYLQKCSSRRWCLLRLGLVKILTFSYKRADFSLIVNISVETFMMSCYWYYFCISYIFHFFQIMMISLFLAWHDQYFIMFKDSNVFEFTNFPFKLKYNNTVVYSANSNYLFSSGKQGKKMVKTILWLNPLCIY